MWPVAKSRLSPELGVGDVVGCPGAADLAGGQLGGAVGRVAVPSQAQLSLGSPSISARTPYSADRSSSPVSTACALCPRPAQARSHRYSSQSNPSPRQTPPPHPPFPPSH